MVESNHYVGFGAVYLEMSDLRFPVSNDKRKRVEVESLPSGQFRGNISVKTEYVGVFPVWDIIIVNGNFHSCFQFNERFYFIAVIS